MHTGAAVCFFLAAVFYLFAWSDAVFGLVFFGVIFEIAAWIVWLNSDSTKQKS